jgi:membrane protease YdiL (CAAX protease family)
VTFCTLCGARADGAFCTQCGTPTTPAGDAHQPASPPAPPTAHGPAPYWMPPAAAPLRAVRPVHRGDPDYLDTDVGAAVIAQGPDRTLLVWETRFVMFAFLLPSIAAAVVLLAQHVAGVGGVTRFPDIVSNQALNLVLGILEYLTVGAVVPLALLLLARTGQTPSTLAIGVRGMMRDLGPAIGIGAASFCSEVVLLIALTPLLAHHSSLVSNVPVGHVPKYYVIWGITISAVTAITEEVIVNGYLITRLEQFGWTPRAALTLSLILRTSYHVYYGIGFLLTVPFGFIVTRSFQKHHRLSRAILAHFLFDAVLLTIAILT